MQCTEQKAVQYTSTTDTTNSPKEEQLESTKSSSDPSAIDGASSNVSSSVQSLSKVHSSIVSSGSTISVFSSSSASSSVFSPQALSSSTPSPHAPSHDVNISSTPTVAGGKDSSLCEDVQLQSRATVDFGWEPGSAYPQQELTNEQVLLGSSMQGVGEVQSSPCSGLSATHPSPLLVEENDDDADSAFSNGGSVCAKTSPPLYYSDSPLSTLSDYPPSTCIPSPAMLHTASSSDSIPSAASIPFPNTQTLNSIPQASPNTFTSTHIPSDFNFSHNSNNSSFVHSQNLHDPEPIPSAHFSMLDSHVFNSSSQPSFGQSDSVLQSLLSEIIALNDDSNTKNVSPSFPMETTMNVDSELFESQHHHPSSLNMPHSQIPGPTHFHGKLIVVDCR